MEEKNEIYQRLTRLETKLDMMGEVRDVANEALQSSKSAHLRINDMEDSQKWLKRASLGGLIAGAISIIVKGKIGL